MLSLNLDANAKIQISSSNQLCITCRLKGTWCLLSFLACYKNNFGYKCLHSTDFMSKEASLLSHSNKSTSTHAQIAFLIYFCNSKRPVIVLDFVSIKTDSAIIKTVHDGGLNTPVHRVQRAALTCKRTTAGLNLQLMDTVLCDNRGDRSHSKKAFHKTLSYIKYLINCDHSTYD